MSLEALAHAFQTKLDNPSDKLLLICLCNFADARGLSYPTTERLTKMSALHPAALEQAFERLQRAGVLTDTTKRTGPAKDVVVWKVLGIGDYAQPLGDGAQLALVPKKPRVKREDVTLAQYVQQCEAEGRDAIPADAAVFAYAVKIKLPVEFVELNWSRFYQDYADSKKLGKDWPKRFYKSVADNWYRFWYHDNDSKCFAITTAGIQQRLYTAKAPMRRVA